MKIISYKEYKKQIAAKNEYRIDESVYKILNDVRKKGDQAIREFTSKFDNIDLYELRISNKEIDQAIKPLDQELIQAINFAAEKVRSFARRQLEQLVDFEHEIENGVICGQVIAPIERIGVYVPGGRYPLVSSVIMGAVPAQVAGVKEICLCSPPGKNGKVHAAILGAAGLIGIKEIYSIGGAQAIAALAYGTETVRKVDKIVGPGNKYVTEAKKAVYGEIGIDFIAGPTEIMVIADNSADPVLIAADLLAQAEHDTEAIPIIVTTSEELCNGVEAELKKQLEQLETAKTANIALEQNGAFIIVKNMKQAISIANEQAPEHLELQVRDAKKYIKQLKHFGSLFIGEYAAEVLGDYSSGLNHTLPTNRAARYTAGLSVFDFIRLQTTLRVDKTGFDKIAKTAEILARTEGLTAHANAILKRKSKK